MCYVFAAMSIIDVNSDLHYDDRDYFSTYMLVEQNKLTSRGCVPRCVLLLIHGGAFFVDVEVCFLHTIS